MGRPKTNESGQLARRNGKPPPGGQLGAMVERMAPTLAQALPRHIGAERLVRVTQSALMSNPRIAECNAASFAACLLTAAQLGLEPNTPLGQGYLIPRKVNGVMTCTWQTGYQGMIDLAYRSGMVTGIDAEVVRAGDEFTWRKGLEPRLDHVPSLDPNRESQPITHAYAVVRIKGADPRFEVLSLAQIEARRMVNDRSDRPTGVWAQHYAEMAKKTAIRAALKYAPKSAEMRTATMLEDAGDTGSYDVVVDRRVTEALAAAGLSYEDAVPDAAPSSAPRSGPDPRVAQMAQAAGVADEDAAKMLADGFDIDPNTGEVLPPGSGGQA